MSDEHARRRWRGVATLRPGLLVLRGAIGAADSHAHHTVQMLVAHDDEVVLADRFGGERACRAAIIPPNVRHRVHRGAADVLLVHVDAEVAVAGALGRLARPADTVEGWCRAAAEFAAAPRFDSAVHDSSAGAGRTRHPAVAEVLRILPGRLNAGPIRLADLARAVRLSESRLAHVFSAEVGLPLRPYVRWLRIQRAVELIATGQSLTAAAHEAGFADSAHLTRVCRGMFGAPPSDFAAIRWVRDLGEFAQV